MLLVGKLWEIADVRRFDPLGSKITQYIYQCFAIISRANLPAEGPALFI